MFIPNLLLALAGADFVPAPADHVLNPDFDTDPVPTEPYEGDTGPEPSHWRWYLSYGGSVNWDTTRGDPAPGSVRVANLYSGVRYDAVAQCVTLSPGPLTLTVRVAALVKAGAACEVRVAVVDQADCSVSAHVLRDLRARNTRNDGTFETVAIGGVAPAGAGAMAIYLAHVNDATAHVGYSDCWYDHVTFAGEAMFKAGFEQ